MGYTRNFEYRVPPHQGQRGSRYINPATTTGYTGAPIVIGAPVKVNTALPADPSLQLTPMILATGAQAPVRGLCGIADYEPIGSYGFAGTDPALATYSDIDKVPVGEAFQVVSGQPTKVCLRNTGSQTFLNTRAYTGRVMVAGLAIATPTVTPGVYLTPGTGDDTSGYWAVTGTASQAWLIVVTVDNTRGEAECVLAF